MVVTLSNLAERVHEAFIVYGYEWKIGGELQTPSLEDVQQALDKMRETLDNEPHNSALDVGRLKMTKIDGFYEVYIYLGDMNA